MTLQTDFESGSILLVSDEEDVQFEVAAGKGAIAFKAVDGDVEFGVEKLAGDIDFTARSIYLNAEDEFFVQGETVSFEAESIVLDAYGGFSFDTTETLSFDGNINFKSTGDFTFDSAAGIVLEADEAAGLLSMGYLRSLKTNDGELIFFDFDNTIQFRGDYRADLRADSDVRISPSLGGVLYSLEYLCVDCYNCKYQRLFWIGHLRVGSKWSVYYDTKSHSHRGG